MVKQYSGMFDLCGPMKGCVVAQGRHLFMEGDLKYKDHLNKVRHFFCFIKKILNRKLDSPNKKQFHAKLSVIFLFSFCYLTSFYFIFLFCLFID